MLIKGVGFRPDATFGSAFNFTLSSIRIDLSTTSAAPDSLADFFSANVGADNTTVLPTGPLTLSSSYTGPPGGPMDFTIRMGFTTPFLYDPNRGNLLLDVRNFGGGPNPAGLNAAFDDQQKTGDGVSRVFNRDVNSPMGVSDTAGLVTQFEFESVPEPRTWIMIALGLLILGKQWRRPRAADRSSPGAASTP